MKNLFLLLIFTVCCMQGYSYTVFRNEASGKLEILNSDQLQSAPEGQQTTSQKKTICIYYPTGTDSIESAYQENSSVLSEIKLTIQQLMESDTCAIDSVIIVGSASPLGGEIFNRELSLRRARSLAEYLKRETSIPASLITVRNTGANWPKLREMVASSSMQYRKEVLDIIDNVPVDKRRNYVLMDLKWGRPYREMMKTFFPELQSSCMGVFYYSIIQPSVPDVIPEPEQKIQSVPDEIPAETVAPVIEKEKGPALNISTNLLYWALLAPNIGVEYCTAQGHWSVNGEFFMPWWKNDKKHKYYQICQYSGEMRYWLNGNGQYKGNFFGAYGNGGLYDLENGDTGYKGHFWGAGATYGYVFRLKPRFRLELSLGVGYLNTRYEQYVPIDDHYVYEKTVRKNYVGPTKVKVGLVWTLIQRNKSGKK